MKSGGGGGRIIQSEPGGSGVSKEHVKLGYSFKYPYKGFWHILDKYPLPLENPYN